MTCEEVKFALSDIGYQKPFEVIFTKTDGTQRKMLCMMEKLEGPPKNNNVVPVMDLEVGQWRSFKVDSVLSITT